MSEQHYLELTPEFLQRVKEFKETFHKKYSDISREKTPERDGQGNKVIDKRPDGYDYIAEAYMRSALDKHFPGWTWEGSNSPVGLIGSEVVYVAGHLCIIDEMLMAYGINPPVRKFLGVGAARIQFKRDSPHTPENLVDFDKNIKAANSNALKYAINRLCRIGDDVYGKRIEEEGAGSLEEVFEVSADASTFNELLKKHSISWGEAFKILGITSATEIASYSEAWETIKKEKNIG